MKQTMNTQTEWNHDIAWEIILNNINERKKQGKPYDDLGRYDDFNEPEIRLQDLEVLKTIKSVDDINFLFWSDIDSPVLFLKNHPHYIELVNITDIINEIHDLAGDWEYVDYVPSEENFRKRGDEVINLIKLYIDNFEVCSRLK